MISASDDKTLKVWNLATGEVITTFTGQSYISRLSNCTDIATSTVASCFYYSPK
ncbi:hypothetical protein [Nostoc sp.]|uniref:hypothetical protein n=1 Tax=Nostoc sp. TaxID=1180 RepID=UPI002FF5BC13